MDASLILKTGTPGAGKTLHTVHEVAKLAEETKRPVFYHGIKGLALDWQPMETAEDWVNCPPGAIIVIDECQSSFRPRGAGSKVPEYIAKFEVHRHSGYTIFLITQHPMLVDQNIRRLVNKHVHLVRKFGQPKATVYQWGSTHEITKNNLSAALQKEFKYPADFFDKYQSAEIHTIKKKLPARIYFMFAAPFIAGALLWFAWGKMSSVGKSETPAPVVQSQQLQPPGESQPRKAGPLSTAEYLAQYQPRIAGMPWTAPVYDEVTTPVQAPYPVGCIVSGSSCRCYDQQQARLAVPEGFCRDFVARGMFVPWKQSPASFEDQRKDAPVAESKSKRPLS